MEYLMVLFNINGQLKSAPDRYTTDHDVHVAGPFDEYYKNF